MFNMDEKSSSLFDEKLLSDFDHDDLNSWNKFFHRSTNLSDEDFLRLNRIFNRFFANAIRYEREQDFQLMEVFLKRSQAEEIRPSFAVKLLPPHHPTQLRSFSTRLKPFPTLEQFSLRSSSNPTESFLPPIRRRKTKSNEENFISLPKKSKSKPEDLPSPVNSRTLSNSLMMYPPVTLQNLYHAIPSATLHFAEDEYVWHANRPVNMILASGVQLPNVLTESIDVKSLSNGEFFSRLIEELIDKAEKRTPADLSSTLKQWKGKETDKSSPLVPVEAMNGFETLLDLVQRRHLGKLQRYFLNVRPNRHYNPYDLITVPEHQIDPENYYVFSVFGILNIRSQGLDVEFFHLSEWYRHAKLWNSAQQIPFFRNYLIGKMFQRWKENIRFSKFVRHRGEIATNHLLFQKNGIFQLAILQIRRVLEEFQRLKFLPTLFNGMHLSLADFQKLVEQHSVDIVQYTTKFFEHIRTIVELTRETCSKRFQCILKSLDEEQITKNARSTSLYEQRIRRENLRQELEQMQNDLRNLCPFFNLCSAMISSALNQIQFETLTQFQLKNVVFLTNLHLTDFDQTRMLRYLPSWDDYFEVFQTILRQIPHLFDEQWQHSLNFDTSIRDLQRFRQNLKEENLTTTCEKCGEDLYRCLEEKSSHSCRCQKGTTPASTKIFVEGRGFFGTTNANRLVRFDLIFSKDPLFELELKKILDEFCLSFDDLDLYCQSNQWLCEINRYCLQWTPNQMKQMSEGKQVFLIEEQLNLLRNWIDKTRSFELIYSTSACPYQLQMNCSLISHDLCQKLERIYSEFGKYLFRYASSNAQQLIDVFQNALQIFDKKPNEIEEFARYSSHLAPHKKEMSNYLQSIEYFSNLFEIIYLHFGYLRDDAQGDPIDKQLSDTWKLFQKRLTDAADFVAQQMLIIKERLRDTFENYYNAAQRLHQESTTGKFLDPQEEPMEIVKLLRKNCLDYMSIEKELRQYSQWRMSLAANSSNPTAEDEIDPQEMENVEQWSNEIELRKDLWKYVEITVSSIDEWKKTFINKFNIRRAQEKIECWMKIAEDFQEKISADDPIILHWIDLLEDFEQKIELLKKLLSEAMTTEQWKLLFRANGCDYDPQTNYRIEDLIQMKILLNENDEIFDQIHKEATREQKLKEKLIHMQSWLNELHYRMTKYRPALKISTVGRRLMSSYRQRLSRYREIRSRSSQSDRKSPSETILAQETAEMNDEAYLMINTEEILRLIEDRLLLLHNNESFYSQRDSRQEQFQQYYRLFDNVQEMTQLWNQTQNKWIFLRSAIVNLNGTQLNSGQFKEILFQFKEIDEQFRNFQKLAFQNPSVAGLAKVEVNRIHFRNWSKAFDELIGQLDFYLNESYRSKFSRFYFLSNEDLIALISTGLDPRSYLPTVRQLFRGIQSINYHLPQQLLASTNSQTINSATIDVYAYRLEGVSLKNSSNEELPLISKLHLQLPKMDTVALSPHLISDQTLTKWFLSLERLMKYSVAKSIFDLIDEKVSEKVEQSVGKDPWKEKKYPAQIILLVEHFLFVLQCEKLVSSGSKSSLLNLKYQTEEQFQHIQLEQRSRDLAFLSQRLYFRDLLTKLLDSGDGLSVNSFEWSSILKYRIDPTSSTERKIHLQLFDNRIIYQYEYLHASTFVLTPLLEKTIYQLSESLRSFRLSILPGHSSLLRFFAQCCGINLVELLCDRSIGLEQIANVHRGVIGSNSWIFFSNFDRLSAECLSILSSSIQHVRIQLEQSKEFFQRQETNLRKWKSQPNLLLFHRPSPPDNEFPTKHTDRLSLLTDESTLIPFPLTYGLFGSRSSIATAPPPLPPSIKFDCRLVSHCSPDLQHLLRSLFYQHRIFSMKEQEDCRETAENLFHLIESFHQLFDGIRPICSSLTLIRSIVEGCRSTSLKRSIVDAFHRWNLFDSNVSLLIEKFFPEQTDPEEEEDEPVTFVDNLDQQAIEEKLRFDDQYLFQLGSELIKALKDNQLIIVTGPPASFKSTLIRLVERTINKQFQITSKSDDEQQLIIVKRIYPNAFDEDEFFGKETSLIEQMQKYFSEILSNELSNDQYWLIFDLNFQSNWLDAAKFHFILHEFLRPFDHRKDRLKLFVECEELPADFLSHSFNLSETKIFSLKKFPRGKAFVEENLRRLEMKFHLQDSTFSSLLAFHDDYIRRLIEFVEKEKMPHDDFDDSLHRFFQIFSSFIDEHLKEVQQQNQFGLDAIYSYALIWSFVHPLDHKFEKDLTNFVRELFSSFDLPTTNCKLTDFYPDLVNSTSLPRLISIHQWLKTAEIDYDCLNEYKSSMHLMKMLIRNDFPVGIYSVEKGFGKTTLTKELLANHSTLRFSPSETKKSSFRRELFVDHQSILHHQKSHREKKSIVWIDDLPRSYEEMIRSFVDSKSTLKNEEFSLLFTADRYSSASKRFRRHFIPVILHETLPNLIDSIYSLPIRDWLEEFAVEAILHPIELAQSTILTLEQIFHFLVERFPSYRWNLHHVQSIVHGMFLLNAKSKRNALNLKLNKKKIADEQTTIIVRLLIHETCRIVLDRLTNAQDRFVFKEYLFKTIVDNYCREIEYEVVSNRENEFAGGNEENSAMRFVQTTIGKKQVKFKLGLVSDRVAMSSLDGSILSVGKLIGLPKLKDPTKIPHPAEVIDQLTERNYFSKEILPLHGKWTNNDELISNHYQQSNEPLLLDALKSCEKKFREQIDSSFRCFALPSIGRHLTNLIRMFSFPSQGHLLLHTHSTGFQREQLVRFASFICRYEFVNAHSSIPTVDEDQAVRHSLRTSSLLAGLKQKNLVVLVRANLLSDEMIEQLFVFTREGTYSGLFSNEELIRIAAALSSGLPTNRRVNKTNAVLKTFFSRVKKRLHLVILDESQYVRHPGFHSSCFVDEYRQWSEEDLRSIVDESIDSTRRNERIASSLARIHLLMNEFQPFSMKHFHRMINLFLHHFDEIQEKENIRLRRFESILERTKRSEQIIAKNEEFLRELEKEISQLKGQLNQLDEEFQAKRNQFTTAMDDCREEEKLINEMSLALARLREDIQSNLAQANPQYENALNALKMLNRADYDEIRTFRQPPQPVLAVMNTICIMFHRKPEWSEAKVLMVKEDFFDDLIFFDKNQITDDVFDMLTKIIQFDTFNPLYVQRSSKAAAGLCAWILAVYQYAKIARSQSTKLEQVKAYQDLFNKRQQILGEKRLFAEKLKSELSELINRRKIHSSQLQTKLKRQNHFQSTIDKTRSMLQLIDEDIGHFRQQCEQAKVNLQTSTADALLLGLYFAYLARFAFDQRGKFLSQCQNSILKEFFPVRHEFRPLEILLDPRQLNKYFLQDHLRATINENSILNALLLLNRLENHFVLFVENPEENLAIWKNFLRENAVKAVEKATEEIRRYEQFRETELNLGSATTRLSSLPDRSQMYSRISSSKTYTTEVTEKSSVWESSMGLSRPATSMILAKSTGTVTLSDFGELKSFLSLPEFSLDEYERPAENFLCLSAKNLPDDFERILLSSMFFGVVLVIDESECLRWNSFLSRYLQWALKGDPSASNFPKRFAYSDQKIFVNSSFRLICNFRHLDRRDLRKEFWQNFLLDESLSSEEISLDLWFNLVEKKCEKSFPEHFRSNQRNANFTREEEFHRRDRLAQLIEERETLTVDSDDLFQLFNEFSAERTALTNSLDEHRIQGEIYRQRIGSETFRSIAKDFAQFYSLLRRSSSLLIFSFDSFKNVLFENLSSRDVSNGSANRLESLNEIRRRETYLRCFQSLSSYLSSALKRVEYEILLVFYVFIQENAENDLQLFDVILSKFDPRRSIHLPDYLDDPRRPAFISKYSWAVIGERQLNEKFVDLAEHLLENELQWKEYFSSSNRIDFLNESPYERTKQVKMNLIDRFLLWLIVRPDRINEILQQFLVYHYGSLLTDKSISAFKQISQLIFDEAIRPKKNFLLISLDSSSFVDPIAYLQRLATEHRRSLRLISSSNRKSLPIILKKHRHSFIVITDVHLIRDFLFEIQDQLRSTFENQLCFICDDEHRHDIPNWIKEESYQMSFSSLSQPSLHFYLQERFQFYPQRVQPLLRFHSHWIQKEIFPTNSTNFIEKDFQIDLDEYLRRSSNKSLVDYSHLITSEDQSSLLNYLEETDNPLALIENLPDRPMNDEKKMYSLMENRSGELLLIKPKRVITDETMLLAESILRSYLTHLRSIYPYAPPHSSTSMVGLFLHVEFEHMKSIEDKLCQQMEHLLDIFVSSNASILQTNPFLHSILFHRQSNIDHFISNYGQALESLSKSTSTQVNLRFIRRRKQFLHFIALEQQRQDDDDLVFQISINASMDNNEKLSVAGYHSIIDQDRKSIRILLKEKSPTSSKSMIILTLDQNQSSEKHYSLPIFHCEQRSSPLLHLSLDQPHL